MGKVKLKIDDFVNTVNNLWEVSKSDLNETKKS